MTHQHNDNNEDKGTVRIDHVIEDLYLAEQKQRENAALDNAVVPWVIELRVVGTPDMLRVPTGMRLTLGRIDYDHDIYPDIDLSAYNAKEHGVSRKHARFTMADNRITIEDLGSSNGTLVNGKHIGVRKPTRIYSGDEIKLGNLVLQVNFLMQPFTNEDTIHDMGNHITVPTIGDKQHILIIDDNKAICAVVRMLALRAGFRASVTHNTSQALSIFDNETIDGIFIELMLEEDNALNFVNYVCKKSNSTVPIIATSSSTGGYRENQALSIGVNQLIDKPLSVDKIVGAFSQFVSSAT